MKFLKPEMDIVSGCRSCNSGKLQRIIEFGEAPLADRLTKKNYRLEPLYRAPLTLAYCRQCSLVQILETVAPETLFGGDYPYYSSVSPALLEHFGQSAAAIIKTRKLNENHLVMEAASNDGYMLQFFHEAGINTLGIDPAPGPVAVAKAKGIPSLNTFFTVELAEKLAGENKKADVFLANNVLAHVADLQGFVAGISMVLKEDGIAVLEFPYLLDLLKHCEFDTIYHQHLCYFSLTALMPLFERYGLYINDIVRTKVHGGSLRIFVSKTERRTQALTELKQLEEEQQLTSTDFFSSFIDKLGRIKDDLNTILQKLKAENKRIVGYGAAAKATTLLHYFNIDDKILDYIVDKKPQEIRLVYAGW